MWLLLSQLLSVNALWTRIDYVVFIKVQEERPLTATIVPIKISKKHIAVRPAIPWTKSGMFEELMGKIYPEYFMSYLNEYIISNKIQGFGIYSFWDRSESQSKPQVRKQKKHYLTFLIRLKNVNTSAVTRPQNRALSWIIRWWSMKSKQREFINFPISLLTSFALRNGRPSINRITCHILKCQRKVQYSP